MLFDFDRFKVIAKLAYRRIGESAYSIDDALRVFKYYFDTYEMIFREAHPAINIVQTARIIEKMPYLPDGIDISPGEYELMIDQHFATIYNGGNCDYNINHFFSGQIREMRFFEVCY